MRPHKKSKYIGIFLSNQITSQREKYNYGYKMGTARLKRQKIMLPVNLAGDPDWQFMEQYIKSIMDKKMMEYIKLCQKELAKLKVININKLEDKVWSEFFLKDIFPSFQRGKRLTKFNQTVGHKPYISSTALNNGIDNFVGNEVGARIFSNCLTIANSGSVGSSFYHSYDFVASDHVTHLKNESFNSFVYLFIATQTNGLSEKYNFNREINDKRISRDKIMLPIKENGDPDYDYMSQYMINLIYKKRMEFVDFYIKTIGKKSEKLIKIKKEKK